MKELSSKGKMPVTKQYVQQIPFYPKVMPVEPQIKAQSSV
jgi:hypothetical protein